METVTMTRYSFTFGILAAGTLAAVLALGGCARGDGGSSGGFATADAAGAALAQAMADGNTAELARVLGPGSEDLLSSGDPVADKIDRAAFVAAYQRSHAFVPAADGAMTLVVGEKQWPLPIPVVKKDAGWQFDAAKGADELVYRRVGRNELGAISVCHGFVAAENEYAAEGRDGDAAGIYALKLVSDEGMHNGLYWPTGDSDAPSPAGPFVAAAASEGYRAAGAPYHGYYYRLLYRQGEHAHGGARDYFKNGLMTEGFALVAWPADYQASGVMTFIVNQDGTVFQKDLGPDTASAVAALDAFNPDDSWKPVSDAGTT
jgi:hypothetical protein